MKSSLFPLVLFFLEGSRTWNIEEEYSIFSADSRICLMFCSNLRHVFDIVQTYFPVNKYVPFFAGISWGPTEFAFSESTFYLAYTLIWHIC